MVTVSVKSKDRMAALTKAIKELAHKEVLVGIPEDKSSRENGRDKINNAELLYIHTHGVRKQEMIQSMNVNIAGGMSYSAAHSLYLKTHGSALLNIPPRPVLEPAIQANKEAIGVQLASASRAAIDGRPGQCVTALNKAGMIAESAAKGWFEKPENHWKPNSPKTIKRKGSDSPLIDTGEMRKSITYVVEDKP